MDVQVFGGDRGAGQMSMCAPLTAVVGGEPWDGGMRVLGTAQGVLPELGTVGFLCPRAAEALRGHCSLDQDLERSQITVCLCNTQT